MRNAPKKRWFFLPKYRVETTRETHICRLAIVAIVTVLLSVFLSEWVKTSVSDDFVSRTIDEYIERNVTDVVSRFKGSVDFLEVSRNEAGQIVAAQTNTEILNDYKTAMTKSVLERVNTTIKADVPVSEIGNMALLDHLNLSFPLWLHLNGTAKVRFETEFLSAGSNQSCYRVVMAVNYSVRPQSQQFKAVVTGSTAFVVSELIIVNPAPQPPVSLFYP